jgi:hypothetical protein
VQALKFGAQLPLAAAFAKRIRKVVPHTAVADAAVMIAVPLSLPRLGQRGFNQAHEIAKPLARAWRLPLDGMLCVRVRDTEPQSSLSLSKRRGNMRGAFTLMRSDSVKGKHVLVVDDVSRQRSSVLARLASPTWCLRVRPHVNLNGEICVSRRTGRARNPTEHGQRDPTVRQYRRPITLGRTAGFSAG